MNYICQAPIPCIAKMNQLSARRYFIVVLALLSLLTACAGTSQQELVEISYYPPPPYEPKLMHMYSITDSSSLAEETEFIKFLLGEEEKYLGIERPYDVDSSPGKLYVLDRKYAKIQVLDLVNQSLYFLHDTGVGELQYPNGIWVTDNDFKYIADMKRQQVVVFDPDDNYVRSYGSPEILSKPTDVAVYGNRVYVTDLEKHAVFVFDRYSDRVLTKFGMDEADLPAGEPPMEWLRGPTNVTVDDSGSVYVTDAFHFMIKQYDTAGKIIKTYGSIGDFSGNLARPKGVAVDRQKNVYVVDASFQNVQIFNEDAQLLLYFGSYGSNRAQRMSLPAGIAIDYDKTNIEYFMQRSPDPTFEVEYLIYVCNMLGEYKINVYGFGSKKGGSE